MKDIGKPSPYEKLMHLTGAFLRDLKLTSNGVVEHHVYTIILYNY